AGVEAVTPRKRFTPNKLVPKPQGDSPVVYGVQPNYVGIGSLRVTGGRFFDEEEASRAEPVCVLGEAARTALFGLDDPLGKFIKVNDQWFRVIGSAGPQAAASGEVSGLPTQDRNNLIYVPTGAAIFRLEDNYSGMRDEIDGVYLRLKPDVDVTTAAATVRSILGTSHRGA